MSVKPILFNTEMVRAILDGRKTVTRRVVKPRYVDGDAGFNIVTNSKTGAFCYIEYYDDYERSTDRHMTPPCHTGDILWVRETWARMMSGDYWYKADGKDETDIGLKIKWRPSIHMPREAARIFLRVTNMRVERLQEITMQDIRREGNVPSCAMCSFNEAKSAHGIKCRQAIERSADCALENQFPDCGFRGLWDSTIKPADRERYGWVSNPWVWVIEFERCKKPEEG